MTEPVRIILPNHFDNTTVNAWLFTGDEPTLVDAGMKTDDSWEAMINQLAEHDLAITDIQKIVITHGHADHMGMAAKIAQASGAKVWIPEYLKPWAIDLMKQLDQRSALYTAAFFSVADETLFPWQAWGSESLLQFWDPIPEEQLIVFKNDAILRLGDQDWQTIYTPGHCINQVVFYQEANRQLISADMILRSTPVPYLDTLLDDPKRRGFTIEPLLNSYDQLARLKIDHVYPGHFDQMGDPSILIEKQVDRISENIHKIRTWVGEGMSSFSDLINNLYPNRVNDSTFFVTISILDYLVDFGELETRMIKDKLEYFPVEPTSPMGSKESVLSVNEEK